MSCNRWWLKNIAPSVTALSSAYTSHTAPNFDSMSMQEANRVSEGISVGAVCTCKLLSMPWRRLPSASHCSSASTVGMASASLLSCRIAHAQCG